MSPLQIFFLPNSPDEDGSSKVFLTPWQNSQQNTSKCHTSCFYEKLTLVQCCPECEQGSENEHNMCTSGMLTGIGGFFWGQYSEAKEEKQLSVPKPHWELIQLKAGLTSILKKKKKKAHKLVFHCHIWRLFRLQILGRASWLGTKERLI